MYPTCKLGLFVGGAALVAACSSSEGASSATTPDGAAPVVTLDGGSDAPPATPFDPFDVPIASATADEKNSFITGDNLFDLALRDADGLGPLYTRTSCGGCHNNGVRGPGSVEKMVIVAADGFTPVPDQTTMLPFGNTVHPLLAGGGKTAIVPPVNAAGLKTSFRLGPPILGRGYVEAVLDSEIMRVAAEQATRTDAIHGRINHVTYASEVSADARFHTHVKGDVLIGRFGLKAKIGALDDFTADALQNDMGITSPLRTTEIPNPDGLTDDMKPGLDVTVESVANRSLYVRLTAIPLRSDTSAEMAPGSALFDSTKCSACHVRSMKTQPDYPIASLANIDAPIYTDLLLHNMGATLADGVIDGEAGPADWRTPPLIGLRFERTFLHDARALTIDDAILMHDGPGSEAAEAVSIYRALSDADKATLQKFVGAL